MAGGQTNKRPTGVLEVEGRTGPVIDGLEAAQGGAGALPGLERPAGVPVLGGTAAIVPYVPP